MLHDHLIEPKVNQSKPLHNHSIVARSDLEIVRFVSEESKKELSERRKENYELEHEENGIQLNF